MADNGESDMGGIPAFPRVLIIDHYDSYTLNTLQLLIPLLGAADHSTPSRCLDRTLESHVLVLPHTHPALREAAFEQRLADNFDVLILSPGPGRPEREADFGAAARILRNAASSIGARIPVLGVCLGHQGLASVFGGNIVRARNIRHGVQSELYWDSGSEGDAREYRHSARWGKGLFDGVPEGTRVVRYNSLIVDEAGVCFLALHQKSMVPEADTVLWTALPSSLCVTAWGFDPPSSIATRPPSRTTSPDPDVGTRAGERVVLALAHRELPLWGVQFHPESIESEQGARMMRNFICLAWSWWGKDERRETFAARLESAQKGLPDWVRALGRELVAAEPEQPSAHSSFQSRMSDPPSLPIGGSVPGPSLGWRVHSRRFPYAPSDTSNAANVPYAGAADAPRIFEALFRSRPQWAHPASSVEPHAANQRAARGDNDAVGAIWLDNARPTDPHSRYSYMSSPAFALAYRARRRQLWLHTPGPSPGCPARRVRIPVDACNTSNAARLDLQRPTCTDARPTFWNWMDALQQDMQARTDFSRCMEDPGQPSASQSSARPTALDDTGDAAKEPTGAAHQRGNLFRTGFVGYWGYEMKGESLGLNDPDEWGKEQASRSTEEDIQGDGQADVDGPVDAEFAFCDRVLALDHLRGEWIAFALTRHIASEAVHSMSSESPAGTTSARVEKGGPLAALQDVLEKNGESHFLCSDVSETERWFDRVGTVLSQASHGSQECFERGSAETGTPASVPPKSSEKNVASISAPVEPRPPLPPLMPDDTPAIYKHKIQLAREQIAQGESYELCLTMQFRGAREAVRNQAAVEDPDHFELYLRLRARNPAPYAAYLHLPFQGPALPHERGRAILCTSPERFMRVTRDGEVEMKPIKGTRARAGWGAGDEEMRPGLTPPRTPEEAEAELRKEAQRLMEDAKRCVELASDPKERAENLMVCSPGCFHHRHLFVFFGFLILLFLLPSTRSLI